ncbi:MAG: hypothetical protein GX146_05870, partial [Myxococcales bacterium]|nr:hypothetical protein [Myxococcales bacterium]
NHTCGIRADDGLVMCWGENEYGQTDPPEDVAFSALRVGGEYTCGLRASDSIEVCWGTQARNFWR